MLHPVILSAFDIKFWNVAIVKFPEHIDIASTGALISKSGKERMQNNQKEFDVAAVHCFRIK
jgi:hypothetical protein